MRRALPLLLCLQACVCAPAPGDLSQLRAADLYGFWITGEGNDATIQAFAPRDEFYAELVGLSDVFFIYTRDAAIPGNHLVQAGTFRVEDGVLVTQARFDVADVFATEFPELGNEIFEFAPGVSMRLESENDPSGSRTYLRSDRCPQPTLPSGYINVPGSRPVRDDGTPNSFAAGTSFAFDADGDSYAFAMNRFITPQFSVYSSNAGTCEWRDFDSPIGGYGEALVRNDRIFVVDQDNTTLALRYADAPLPERADRMPDWRLPPLPPVNGSATVALALDDDDRALIVSTNPNDGLLVFADDGDRFVDVTPADNGDLDLMRVLDARWVDGALLVLLAGPTTSLVRLADGAWQRLVEPQVETIAGQIDSLGRAHLVRIAGSFVYQRNVEFSDEPEGVFDLGVAPLALLALGDDDVPVVVLTATDSTAFPITVWRSRDDAWTREAPLASLTDGISPGITGSLSLVVGSEGRLLFGGPITSILERLPDSAHAPQEVTVQVEIDGDAAGVLVESDALGLSCGDTCAAPALVGSFPDVRVTPFAGSRATLEIGCERFCNYIVTPTPSLRVRVESEILDRHAVAGVLDGALRGVDVTSSGGRLIGLATYAGPSTQLGGAQLPDHSSTLGHVVVGFRTAGDASAVDFAVDLDRAEGAAVASTGDGGAFVVGTFGGTLALGGDLATLGSSDVLVARLAGDGAVVARRGIGGLGPDEGVTAVDDGSGGVLVAAVFSDAFDPGDGTTVAAPALSLLRYDADLTLAWHVTLPGTPSRFRARVAREGGVAGMLVRHDGGIDVGTGPLTLVVVDVTTGAVVSTVPIGTPGTLSPDAMLATAPGELVVVTTCAGAIEVGASAATGAGTFCVAHVAIDGTLASLDVLPPIGINTLNTFSGAATDADGLIVAGLNDNGLLTIARVVDRAVDYSRIYAGDVSCAAVRQGVAQAMFACSRAGGDVGRAIPQVGPGDAVFAVSATPR